MAAAMTGSPSAAHLLAASAAPGTAIVQRPSTVPAHATRQLSDSLARPQQQQQQQDEQQQHVAPASHRPATASAGTREPARGAPKSSPPLHRKPNRYTRPDEGAVLALSKDSMELELKQLRSFNRSVYESRVRQAYLEERVLRGLYTQKQSIRHSEMLAAQRRRQAENARREQTVRTPYLIARESRRREEAFRVEARAKSAPVFRDLQAIESQLEKANLKARGVTASSSVAKRATPHQLAKRVTIPPPESLMNPRNQMTSPLPEKKAMLPYVQKTMPKLRAEGDLSSLGAKAVLSHIPELFEAKRTADWEAERNGKPRPPLIQAARAYLTLKGGETFAREQLAMLRYACALQSDRPKVALFQGMAGWDDTATPWDNTKAAACLLLMMWLQPPPDEALQVSRRFESRRRADEILDDLPVELRLSDVDIVVRHLQRKRLVSSVGGDVLREAALRLELPQAPPPAPQRAAPCVDVDQLLLAWMDIWGSWEWKEDKDLLTSVIAKFGLKGSPRKTSLLVAAGEAARSRARGGEQGQVGSELQ